MPPPPIPDWEVRLAGWAYLTLEAVTIAAVCVLGITFAAWLVRELRRQPYVPWPSPSGYIWWRIQRRRGRAPSGRGDRP